MRDILTYEGLEILLKNIVVVIDIREKMNKHITDYFDKKKIKYIKNIIRYGDYTCYIESNKYTRDVLGKNDLWFDDLLCIKKKNNISELAEIIKEKEKIENEFEVSAYKKVKLLLFVEDTNGLSTILNRRYDYDSMDLYTSLKEIETKYNFTTNYVSKELMGMEIYYTLYYAVKNYLKY